MIYIVNHNSILSTLTAQTLNSGVLDIRSNAEFVKMFVADSLKWNVIKTTPGKQLSVILTLGLISPLLDITLTVSLFIMPIFFASSWHIAR